MGNLSQLEIDALINNMNASSAALTEEAASPRFMSMFEPVDEELSLPSGSSRSYRLYDFRRPEKLSKDQARLLRAHFGLFWRRVANYLANLSRTNVEVDLVEVDQTTYKEIFTSHGVPAVMSTFTLSGEHQGMLKINLSQVFSLVDRLMGGSGLSSIRPRSLTEFERNLSTDLCSTMLGFYADISGASSFSVDNVETDERLLPRRLSGDDLMVRAIYDLRIGQHSGYLNLYLPFKSLSNVIGAAAKDRVVVKETQAQDIPPVVNRLALPVTVILGEATLSAHNVSQLKAGSVLALDQEESSPLKVTIGNQARFRARPGLVGNRMAVSIVGNWEGK